MRFLGLVTHDQLTAIASRADVACSRAGWRRTATPREELPWRSSSSRRSGCPVVATRHADIPFVVPRSHELVAEEDVEGLATALIRVAGETPEARRGRAREARAFVEDRHDARRLAGVVEGVYDEVLG